VRFNLDSVNVQIENRVAVSSCLLRCLAHLKFAEKQLQILRLPPLCFGRSDDKAVWLQGSERDARVSTATGRVSGDTMESAAHPLTSFVFSHRKDGPPSAWFPAQADEEDLS